MTDLSVAAARELDAQRQYMDARLRLARVARDLRDLVNETDPARQFRAPATDPGDR